MYIKQVNTTKNEIDIILYLIDNCNYNCSYCYNRFPRSYKNLNLIKIFNFISYIESITNYNINIQLIGGEPMLYNFLKDLYDKFDNNIRIANILMYSNLSYPVKDYKKILINKKNTMFFSWHSQNINFVEKIKQLIDYNKQIHVSVMYEHYHTTEALQLFKNMSSYVNSINMHMIDENINAYTKQELLHFKENNTDFKTTIILMNGKIVKTTNSHFYLDEKTYCFKNWLCEAGNKMLYVHVDGNVYPCPDFYYRKFNPIANIYTDNFKLKLHNVLCPFTKCACGHDQVKYNIFKKTGQLIK